MSKSIDEQEKIAQKELSQPFFGKTVTGFGNPQAWMHVLDAVTEGPKPPLRIQNPGDARRYVVRLGQSGFYEVHDKFVKSQGRFYKEKQALPPGRRLPPHQSTTYYEPNNMSFNPGSFRPTSSNKEMIVGLRFAARHALINRIIVNDTGTYYRPYAFRYRNKAEEYLQTLIHKTPDKWARSLEDLRAKEGKKEKGSTIYNECMVRVSWKCDDFSSQVTIYSDNAESRMLAILHAKMIEARLASNPKLYKQAPYFWFPEYRAPISFWGNCVGGLKGLGALLFNGNGIFFESGALKLYSQEEQDRDLLIHWEIAFSMACLSGCIELLKKLHNLNVDLASCASFSEKLEKAYSDNKPELWLYLMFIKEKIILSDEQIFTLIPILLDKVKVDTYQARDYASNRKYSAVKVNEYLAAIKFILDGTFDHFLWHINTATPILLDSVKNALLAGLATRARDYLWIKHHQILFSESRKNEEVILKAVLDCEYRYGKPQNENCPSVWIQFYCSLFRLFKNHNYALPNYGYLHAFRHLPLEKLTPDVFHALKLPNLTEEKTLIVYLHCLNRGRLFSCDASKNSVICKYVANCLGYYIPCHDSSFSLIDKNRFEKPFKAFQDAALLLESKGLDPANLQLLELVRKNSGKYVVEASAACLRLIPKAAPSTVTEYILRQVANENDYEAQIEAYNQALKEFRLCDPDSIERSLLDLVKSQSQRGKTGMLSVCKAYHPYRHFQPSEEIRNHILDEVKKSADFQEHMRAYMDVLKQVMKHHKDPSQLHSLDKAKTRKLNIERAKTIMKVFFWTLVGLIVGLVLYLANRIKFKATIEAMPLCPSH